MEAPLYQVSQMNLVSALSNKDFNSLFSYCFLDVSRHTSSGSSTAEIGGLCQSTESINSTWRSVGDMSAYSVDCVPGATQPLAGEENIKSPSNYSVGRSRTASGSSGSAVHGLNISPSSYSSGSGSLRGENIGMSTNTGCPTRERTSSSVSGVSGGGRARYISDDLDINENSDGEGGGDEGGCTCMFSMEDLDSLENSLEDFNGFGHISGRNYNIEGGQSPLSSFLNKPVSLRIEFGACTRLGPKSKQEDRFVMIPSLDNPAKRGAEVEGFDDDSNTHRCDNSYAAVYDGEYYRDAVWHLQIVIVGLLFFLCFLSLLM